MRGMILTGLFLISAGLAATDNSKSVVEAQIVSATDGVHPGTSAKLAIVAQIAPGFHINDHKPTLDYLIPTDVKLDPAKDISLENVVYPSGVPVKFAFSDQALSVYEGTLLVGTQLKFSKVSRPGPTPSRASSPTRHATTTPACHPPAFL